MSHLAIRQRCDAAYVREQLVEWQADGTPDAPLRLLVLRRKGSARPIRSYSVEQHDLDTCTKRIVRDVNNEAEMLQPEAFVGYVEALYGDASEAAASFGVSVTWQELDSGTDDPKSWGGYAYDDRRGPLAVMQKHAARALDRADKKDEMMGRKDELIVKLVEGFTQKQSEREGKLLEGLLTMEGRLIEAWSALQDATDRKAGRDAEARKADATIAVWQDIAKTIKTVGPVAANRMLFGGEKVLPEITAHPLVAMSQTLYDELGEENLRAMQLALADKPRALLIIAEIIRAGLDARDIDAARAKLAADFEATAHAAEAAQKAAAE